MRAILSLIVCLSAFAESSETINYWIAPRAPYMLRLAVKEATAAWTAQVGVEFVRTADWTRADFCIVWDRQYDLPGTLACVKLGDVIPMVYVRVNANRKDGWRWRLGDFGRWGKTCALTGAVFHELGHILGLPDIDSGAKNLRDPLSNRTEWASMYGRAWENKLVIKTSDLEAFARRGKRPAADIGCGGLKP